MQVFLGLGASNSKLEFEELIRRYKLRPDQNPDLVLVNANRGSQNVVKTVNQWPDYEIYIDTQLAAAGVSASDVTFIWLKTDDTSGKIDRMTKDEYLAYLESNMTAAINLIKAKFPNAEIMLTGRHDGYEVPHITPRAQYNDIVCQKLVGLDVIFGPSFYHQCVTGEWDITCVQNDGVHPNEKGLKVACDLLENWLVDSTDWYVVTDDTEEPAPVQPIYSAADKPRHTIGFHWGPHAFDMVYTDAEYSKIVELAGGAGSTLPLRFRVLSKGDGSLGIDSSAIPEMFYFLEKIRFEGIRIQGVLCIYEALTYEAIDTYIQGFIVRGMEITAFEIGNECFSQYNTFAEYMSVAEALVDSLDAIHPGIPIIFPMAGRPIDSDLDGVPGEADDIITSRDIGQKHADWNNALAEWLKTQPEWFGIAPHIYPNQREFVNSPNIPMNQVVIDGEDNQALTNFFTGFILEIPNAIAHYRKTLWYINEKFPGRPVYVTEFGTPQAELRNTLAFSSYLWAVFTDIVSIGILDAPCEVYWYFHSGISSASSGSYYPAKKNIDTGTGLISRLEWDVISLWRNAPDIEEGAQTYYFGFSGKVYDGRGYSLFMADGSKPAFLEPKELHGTEPVTDLQIYIQKPKDIIVDPPVDPEPTEEYVPVEVDVVVGTQVLSQEQEVEFNVTAITTIDSDGSTIDSASGTATSKAKKTITVMMEIPKTEKRVYYEKKVVDGGGDTGGGDGGGGDTGGGDGGGNTEIQPIDAPVLTFNNEVEFRDFLRFHGLADYDVLQPTFDNTETPEQVLPFKEMRWQFDGVEYNLNTVDPNYYAISEEANQAYLHEEAFAEKRYVMLFDHSAMAKNYRMWLTIGNKCGDYRFVDNVITNLATGQKAVFKNAWNWSNRNGHHIFNNNLVTWLLWGKGKAETTQKAAFSNRMPAAGTSCDFSYVGYGQEGHETTTLYWQGMTDVYGHLR